MNLGTKKWKKARANFSGVRDDAGRCGTACTRACPWDAHCLPARGEITSFSKKPSFLGNHSKYVGKHQPRHAARPRPRHAAKTKAAPYGHAAKAGACSSQGEGSPHGQAAKAKACLLACVHAAKAKPRHAAKAMACLRGHAGMPLGAGSSKALACTQPRRVRGMPRGWDAKAVACPWDP